MAQLNIIKLPAAFLRKKTARVEKVSDSESKALSDMAKAMYLNHGVGLAANQVGIDKQLAVIDTGNGLIKLINPVIVKRMGLETQEEGCLSVPGVSVKVRRAEGVVVNFLDENGIATRLKADGLLARAIQHEIDHLSGKLIIDYLNPIKRILVRKKPGGGEI